VSFSEIDRVSIIGEIAAMHENLTPDISLGTHFFSELVETEMLYFALFPDREGSLLNHEFFDGAPNQLATLLPSEARWADVVRVIDAGRSGKAQDPLTLHANTVEQRVVFYRNAQTN